MKTKQGEKPNKGRNSEYFNDLNKGIYAKRKRETELNEQNCMK